MNLTTNILGASNWFTAHPTLVVIIMIWSIAWKGLALWKSAQRNEQYWFIALLFINTVGILDIIYIYFFTKDSKVEVIKN
ncbi:MAG: DUF5652 family protein [Minisyncoccia bacterium]